MKSKILILVVVLLVGAYAAFACGFRECGGGNDKCCTDVWNAVYYCKAVSPSKK